MISHLSLVLLCEETTATNSNGPATDLPLCVSRALRSSHPALFASARIIIIKPGIFSPIALRRNYQGCIGEHFQFVLLHCSHIPQLG